MNTQPDTIQRPQEAYAGLFLQEYETARYLPEDYEPQIAPQIIIPAQAEDLPDVSFWQGDINWDVLITHTRAVKCRISQGNWVDSKWERNYREGRRVGAILGGYHFYDDRYSPEVQAQTILAAMHGKHLEMEIFIDWEVVYGGPYGGLKNVNKLIRLLNAAGIKQVCKSAGIYTGFYFFTEHTNATTDAAELAYITNEAVPLWIAWYANAQIVRIPECFVTWTHWQYGTPVRDWGQATAEIDMNKPNATPAQFTEKYTGTTTPPPGGSMTCYKLKQDLSIRSQPDYKADNSNVIGVLHAGDIVEGQIIQTPSDEVKQWVQFTRIHRLGGPVEDLTGYCSGYDKYVEVTDCPTAPPSGNIHMDITLLNNGTISGTWTGA